MKWILISLLSIPAFCWSANYNSDFERWQKFYGSQEKAQVMMDINERAKQTSPGFASKTGAFTLRILPAVIGFAGGYQAGWEGNTNFSQFRTNEQRFQTALIGVVGAELVAGIFNAVFRIERYKLGILAGVNSN